MCLLLLLLLPSVFLFIWDAFVAYRGCIFIYFEGIFTYDGYMLLLILDVRF